MQIRWVNMHWTAQGAIASSYSWREKEDIPWFYRPVRDVVLSQHCCEWHCVHSEQRISLDRIVAVKETRWKHMFHRHQQLWLIDLTWFSHTFNMLVIGEQMVHSKRSISMEEIADDLLIAMRKNLQEREWLLFTILSTTSSRIKQHEDRLTKFSVHWDSILTVERSTNGIDITKKSLRNGHRGTFNVFGHA